MFPLNSNDQYIDSNGKRSKLGDAIGSGGSGSELPEHSAADAGKVLSVDDSGNLAWSEIQSTDTHYTKSKVSNISTNVNTYAKGVL